MSWDSQEAQAPSERIANPVPVTIQNWAPPVPPPCVRNTTMRTYLIGTTPGYSSVQMSYEPKRMRTLIYVIDSAVSITTDMPVASPDASADATHAPQGAYLPPLASGNPLELFGPDALWINSLGTATRVTVIKEYS